MSVSSEPNSTSPDRRRPFRDVDEIKEFIRNHIDLWDRERGRTLQMKAEFAKGTGPMIWALANHSVVTARALLLLINNGPLVAAMPQIRLMMDLALTAAWLSVHPNAAGALYYEHLRQRKAAIDEVLLGKRPGLSEKDRDAILAEMDEFVGDRHPTGQYAEKRFKAMEGGADVYISYRIASTFSHASAELADTYLTSVPESVDSPLGIALSPDEDVDTFQREAWIGTAAAMLVLALTAENAIDSKGRFKTQLVKSAKRLGVSMDIALASTAVTP